jgi:hypothetical protein
METNWLMTLSLDKEIMMLLNEKVSNLKEEKLTKDSGSHEIQIDKMSQSLFEKLLGFLTHQVKGDPDWVKMTLSFQLLQH